jgi:hypothetical protein
MTALLAVLPAPANGQDRAPGTVPGMGSVMPQTTNLNFANSQQAADSGPDYDSAVSFIDSAVPASQVRLRFDANYDDRRPTRAEYLFSKSGVPGSPGWWVPEKRVDYQELTSYVEVAYQGMLSVFLEMPTRWVNPEVNPNDWGLGDINGGVKFALFTSPGMTTTFQLRGTFPTRSGPGLSTMHYSIEPGLLLFLRPLDWLAVEGEARYNVPVTGTDFAGDVVRYGLGLSFGERKYDSEWFTPVIEMVGWTVLNGKEMLLLTDGPAIRSAGGETIVNAMAGLRFGLGDQGDIYLGYGRSLTGDAWQHQLWRLEFRVRF